MGTITPINPRVVFVSATQPADITEGKIWYNTSDNKVYTSNGSAYVMLGADTTYIDRQQLEQDINILINGASSSSTLNDYDYMFLDIFSSASGLEGSVDGAETTSVHSGVYFKNSIIDTSTTDEVTQAFNQLAQTTTYKGTQILMKGDFILTEIEKESLCTATKCYVYDNATGDLLGTGTFSQVTHKVALAVPLTDAKYYDIVCGSDGASYQQRDSDTQSFPYVGTNVNFIKSRNFDGSSWSDDTAQAINVKFATTSSVTEFVDALVQTNAQTIEANPLAHQIYSHYALAGTGALTYDISFDDGTTWIEDQEFNTKNTSVHDGTEMIIKFNLLGTGAGNTAFIEDYAVMLY